MNSEFIPFSQVAIAEDEIAAVADVLRSGWITTGPQTKRFENAFGEYLGVADLQTIAVSSATAGLHLALEALGIGPGDEVIAPTLTFTATVEVVRYLGADPVLVDVDPATLTIDVSAIRSAITPRTKAIIPVHYAGLACDMAAILDVARQHGLRVVEDAAHALPSTFDGRMVGTLESDATVFSFYANKTMTTGEGGMVITRNPEAARRMRLMRLHGISTDAFNRFVATKPSWFYEVVAPGFKYNLTDIAAALGIRQLAKLPAFSARRQQLAARYNDALASLPLTLPADARPGDIHAWHLYVIRLQDGVRKSRDDVIQALADRGIGTSVHYVPLHRHPYWRDRYSLSAETFPRADAAYQRMISIPLSAAMSDVAQERVIAALHDALDEQSSVDA